MSVEEKIKEYERLGLFDKDVEDDPISKGLNPEDIDYLKDGFFDRIKTKIANSVAKWYYEREIRRGDFIIKEVKGFHHYQKLSGGVIITCNHFHPYDNYAIDRTLQPSLGKKRLYKVIKEGNYTSFKGLFGYFFRNCNTLPLSSNLLTMKKFLKGMEELLKRGEKILVYPEQSMWLNYKKPRPLKPGAFNFAVKNNVPVLPVFITMEEVVNKKGKKVNAFILNFLQPIYPDENLTAKENQVYMAEKNYELWKETYESFYNKKLVYEE
ncbi:MAG: 1-acyl-sn-glycerol-3-phosphate acyltransferase [Clostridiales bacterium]|nr:1-acyl-sn-glycerol-3-phosphate acyltransferase [Clostridiales bacterium]